MKNKFISVVFALILTACSQIEMEESVPKYFVGNTLSPNYPVFLWSGTPGIMICELYDRNATVLIISVDGEMVSVEVLNTGTPAPNYISPSVVINRSDGVPSCKKNDILLIHRVDRNSFNKAMI